jgi:hypothetical protein
MATVRYRKQGAATTTRGRHYKKKFLLTTGKSRWQMGVFVVKYSLGRNNISDAYRVVKDLSRIFRTVVDEFQEVVDR